MSDIACIRNQMRQHRAQLSQRDQQKASSLITQQLIHHPHLKRSQHIAAYLASENEIDLSDWFEHIWMHNKRCYLPCVQGKQLDFVNYNPKEPLKPNRWNIFEPTSRNSIEPHKLDVILLPLVAFDDKGHRIGRGGGYYDRTLSFLNSFPGKEKKPYLIGLAYNSQRINRFTPASWDIPLQEVITEKGIYKF